MLCLIPLAIGQSVSQSVIYSIKKQTIICDIITCESLGVIKSNHGVYTKEKIRGIKASRLLCIEKIKDLKEEYCLMQDRGFIHNKIDNIGNGIIFLEYNKNIGAVSFAKPDNNNSSHIDIGVMVWRTDLLKKITFKFWDDDCKKCPCDPWRKEVNEMGYDFCYYPIKEWLATRERE
jgi:hypothetical protein